MAKASSPKEARPHKEKLKHVFAGAGAGLVASFVTCPLDVVKTRLQNQTNSFVSSPNGAYYRGTIGSLKKIWAVEGINGLYMGLAPTLLGYLPSWAIYFACYDAFKNSARHLLNESSCSSLVHVGSAMAAGCLSTLATAPLWVIKTRIMTQNKTTPYYYHGISDAFKTILRVEGIKGFYKGLTPSLIGVSHVIVQFPLYERLKIDLAVYDSKDGKIYKGSILAASSLSIMVASICTYPHEVLRTRFQNQTKPPFKYQGILNSCRTILKEESLTGFYKGFFTNLIRTVPCTAMTILTYEVICEKIDKILYKC